AAAQHSQTEAHVLHKILDQAGSAHVAALLLELFNTTQGLQRRATRLLGTHALRCEFVDLILQMKLKLVAQIDLRFVLTEKRTQTKRQFVAPTHGFVPYGASSTRSIANERRFHCACSRRRYFAPSGVSE